MDRADVPINPCVFVAMPSLFQDGEGALIFLLYILHSTSTSHKMSSSLNFLLSNTNDECNQSTAVPYIPDGYSRKEWQAEHEAELAELQSRKEDFIGHRGAAAQPVRHLSEDIDSNTHVHFHKPLSADVGEGQSTDSEGETILEKMRRQWGRDGDDDDESLIP